MLGVVARTDPFPWWGTLKQWISETVLVTARGRWSQRATDSSKTCGYLNTKKLSKVCSSGAIVQLLVGLDL